MPLKVSRTNPENDSQLSIALVLSNVVELLSHKFLYDVITFVSTQVEISFDLK